MEGGVGQGEARGGQERGEVSPVPRRIKIIVSIMIMIIILMTKITLHKEEHEVWIHRRRGGRGERGRRAGPPR